MQWRQDVLLRELALWEAASEAVSRSQPHHGFAEPSAPWFALREMVGRLSHNSPAPRQQMSKSKDIATNRDLAAAVAEQVQAAYSGKCWAVVQGGARFVQVLLGLFPDTISMLKSQIVGGNVQQQAPSDEALSGTTLFNELAEALHAVVLDSDESDAAEDAKANNAADRHTCAEQLLKTLLEIVGKLRHHELDALGSAFRRPSLCALLVESPSSGSLHLLCMQLLQALLAGKELYALAHGADCHENLLLAVANLLIIPSIDSRPDDDATLGHDTPELQQCRVSALQVFCRCLASAPRLDMVLQFRGALTVHGETVETVLQRVVFLCHHELLCLGIHGVDGGSWHDSSLHECAKRRQRAIELSLMILSSFVWHAIPDMQAPDHAMACSEACAALGRMRPLVASIVDMVGRRAARSPYYTRLLSSASALRVLLAHAGGEDGCIASGDGGVVSGTSRVSAVMAPLMVVD